jgi:N-acetylmuramoyl-L-alanine amidase
LTLIFIDAGHGGKDSGATGHGIYEKDVVLKIAKKMESLLNQYENVQVEMSRESDQTLSLSERTKKANNLNADVLISVHNNGHTSDAKGFESFRYLTTDSGTVALQNVMHSEIMKAIGKYNVVDRGKKSANFHMLRESKMKAVLTENLFITSSSDNKLLKDGSFLDDIAEGHVNGLVAFFGLKKKNTSTPQPDQPTKDEKLWKVQVGAFSEKENAEELANDLFKQGYRPFIKYE